VNGIHQWCHQWDTLSEIQFGIPAMMPLRPVRGQEKIRMRLRTGVFCCLAAWACAATVPRPGIKTPGVQIPFADLKPEAEFAVAAEWVAFAEAPLTADASGLYKIDAKKNELGAAVAP